MQRHVVGGLTVVFTLFLASSCSDMSVFGPQEAAPASIEVRSLREGGLVPLGDSVSYVVHAERQAGEDLLLEASLLDSAGVEAWSGTLASPQPEEELKLKLPALPAGLYRLKLVLTRASGATLEKEVSFFYVTGDFAIEGISSFPPTILPESRILLRADLRYPEGSDPWVRWTQDGQALASGRVSEGLHQVTWQAPQAEGVYPVEVELFPAPPPAGRDFRFSSPLLAAAKLFVTPSTAAASEELGPLESYYVLFHFDGSLRDAASPAAAEATAFGSAEVSKSGLRLAENAGARYPRLLLPAPGGQPSPCTLTLRLKLEGGAAGRDLLTTESSDRAFRLKLALDEEGRPWAELLLPTGAAARLASGMPPLAPGRDYRLDLSLLPGPRSLTAMWFLDGLQTSLTTLKADGAPLSSEGTTLIGGDNGAPGVISELGVFYQDEAGHPSADPGIYRWVMERQLGRRLILAEGFEGSLLPEGFLAAPEAAARLSGGNLLLAPEAALTLPFFDLNAAAPGPTVLEVVFAAPLPAGTAASLTWESDGKAFLDILPEGKALAFGREVASFPALTDKLRLELGEKSLVLQAPEPSQAVELALPGPSLGRERWLSVSVRSPAGETGLSIDRVLAFLKIAE
jgi:hypothetical protein